MINRLIRWYNKRAAKKIEKHSIWLCYDGCKAIVTGTRSGFVFYKTLTAKHNFEYKMTACNFKSIFKPYKG